MTTEATTKLTQENLQGIHEAMRHTAQMWVSGLLTDRDVAEHFAMLANNFVKLDQLGQLSGLVDPATGLRY
jgi:hypothetical protein